MQGFAVHRSLLRDRTLLAVVGELDVATAPLVDEHTEAVVAAGAPLVVDLSACTFLDSTGSRSVGRVARAATGAGLAVAVVCPVATRTVRRVVDHIGLAALAPVVETLAQALDVTGTGTGSGGGLATGATGTDGP